MNCIVNSRSSNSSQQKRQIFLQQPQYEISYIMLLSSYTSSTGKTQWLLSVVQMQKPTRKKFLYFFGKNKTDDSFLIKLNVEENQYFLYMVKMNNENDTCSNCLSSTAISNLCKNKNASNTHCIYKPLSCTSHAKNCHMALVHIWQQTSACYKHNTAKYLVISCAIQEHH